MQNLKYSEIYSHYVAFNFGMGSLMFSTITTGDLKYHRLRMVAGITQWAQTTFYKFSL